MCMTAEIKTAVSIFAEKNGRITTTLIFGSALPYSYGIRENMCESKRTGRKENLNPNK